MKNVSIYIVRHGETLFNKKMIIQGFSDAPLTQEGVEQALDLGKTLSNMKFDAVYSSDFRRAFETAEYIMSNNNFPSPVIPHKSFREFNFGEYEGDTSHGFWDRIGEKYNLDMDYIIEHDFMRRYDYLYDEVLNPTAEKREDFNKRLKEGITDVSNRAINEGHENIMIVCHGVTMTGLLYILDENFKLKGFFRNTSVTKVDFDGNDYDVKFVGKIAEEI